VKHAAAIERIRTEPSWFLREAMGFHAWSRQQQVVESVRDNTRTAVRSCHGAGKTAIAARVALWFLAAFPRSRVVTTAPTWAQVRDLLWREVHVACRGAGGFFDGDLYDTRLELATDWFALGLSTDRPERFQGFAAEAEGRLMATADAIFTLVQALDEYVEVLDRAGDPTFDDHVAELRKLVRNLRRRAGGSADQDQLLRPRLTLIQGGSVWAGFLADHPELTLATDSGRPVTTTSCSRPSPGRWTTSSGRGRPKPARLPASSTGPTSSGRCTATRGEPGSVGSRSGSASSGDRAGSSDSAHGTEAPAACGACPAHGSRSGRSYSTRCREADAPEGRGANVALA
jgi:hypothetical protein